jgi:hypothetical protein
MPTNDTCRNANDNALEFVEGGDALPPLEAAVGPAQPPPEPMPPIQPQPEPPGPKPAPPPVS